MTEINKEAGLLNAAGKSVLNIGKQAIKNPVKSAFKGLVATAYIDMGKDALKKMNKELNSVNNTANIINKNVNNAANMINKNVNNAANMINKNVNNTANMINKLAFESYNKNLNNNNFKNDAKKYSNNTQQNKENIKKYMNSEDDKKFSALPYIVGGTTIALGVAQAIVHKDPKYPFVSFAQGTQDAAKKISSKLLKKNPVGRSFSSIIKGADKISLKQKEKLIELYKRDHPFKNITIEDIDKILKADNATFANNPDMRKFVDTINNYLKEGGKTYSNIEDKLRKEFHDAGFFTGTIKKTQDNAIKFNYSQQDKNIIKDFSKLIDDSRINKANFSKSEIDEIVKETHKKYGKKIPDVEIKKTINQWQNSKKKENLKKVLDNLTKGVGTGVAIGAGDFAIHSLGDEYFTRKDNNELKKRLRQDYNNGVYDILDINTKKDEKNNNLYKTPFERAKEIEKKTNYAFNKQASMKKETKDLLKTIAKEDIFDNMKRSVIYATAPIAVGKIVNRNLKGRLEKINGKDEDGKHLSNSNKIILEMPLNSSGQIDFKQMNKIASVSPAVKKKIKDAAINDARSAVRVISWITPPAILTAATKRNFKGNLEKINDDEIKPLEAGKARIIIERNLNDNNGGTYYNANIPKGGSR